MDDGLEAAYLAVERAYGQGEFSAALQLATELQTRIAAGREDLLDHRLNLLIGHIHGFGLGQPAEAAAAYTQVLATCSNPAYRDLASQGLARTGGIAHHGSGDYVIAFSTDSASRIPHQPAGPVRSVPILHDDHVSPLFLAAIEATEEAILNALFTAETTSGKGGARVEALPVQRVLELLKK